MTLTEAPNDLGGRLCRNCALTTPELPVRCSQRQESCYIMIVGGPAMWPRNLSPDDSYFRSSNFSLCTVDEGDFLSEVESSHRH